MAKRKLAEIRTVYRCSSSIANFRDKLDRSLGLETWHWWKNRNDRAIFFGLYHWKDYLRFIWHRGPKKAFWCGSDILTLRGSGYFPPKWLGTYAKFWQWIIPLISAKHYCENEVEQQALNDLGIYAEIRPMLFDDPDKYQVCYKWSETPRYFATYHKGREREYGYSDWGIVDFLEGLPEEEFNEKIKGYQGAIRFNAFDGFAESLAKSVLMGQYPISVIKYPFIAHLKEDIEFIPGKEPNYQGSNYWRQTLKENKEEVINNWDI